MLNNRRQFLMTTGLAAGGAFMGTFRLAATGFSASLAEDEVSAVIAHYGCRIRTRRKGDHSTEFKVKVRSIDQFVKIFDPQNLPFKRIFVGPGNTMHFKHHDTAFTIVNVV